jgi:cyclase
MRRLYILPFVLLTALSASAQRDFSKVEIKVQKVSGGIYMLTGAGGNIGLSVGDDGVIVIDDQYAPIVPKIEAAIRGITDKPVRFIVNTHYHGDHTGGNEQLGKSYPIVAQENVRRRLVSGTTVFGEATPPAPKTALPVITFDHSLSLHLNGEEVRAVHMPHGHTDGDSVIYFTKSNVIHMGDDYFNGMFPFVDAENGGSVRGMIASVDTVLATVPEDVKVIPGHGALSDKNGLRAFGDVLKGSVAAVQRGLDAGKSLEQLKADKVLAAWDPWGQGFIKTDMFLEFIYRELTKK